jgi:hypothetical protein
MLPEFVCLNSKSFKGYEYILSTSQPFSLFRVYQFNDYRDLEGLQVKYNLLNNCLRIPNYNILLVYFGTLETVREAPVLGHLVDQSVKNQFENLLEFYDKERINGNESRFKKYETR